MNGTRRILVVAILVASAGFVALVALRWGGAVAQMEEGDVIAAFAARYAAEVEGGRPADCSAVPGRGHVWIVVSCGPVPFDAARHRTYRVDRFGRLVGGAGAL